MDNVYEIGILMDFYGQLITERQYQIMDLHYNNDYSLGEIAQLLNISRQGVYDNIKKGKQLLYEFEKKLGLVERFRQQKDVCEEALSLMENVIKGECDKKNIKDLSRVRDLLIRLRELL